MAVSALEKHYRVNEIAEMWAYSPDTIQRLFENEPDVIKTGTEESRFKRKRILLSVPETVLIRVHERIRNKGKR